MNSKSKYNTNQIYLKNKSTKVDTTDNANFVNLIYNTETTLRSQTGPFPPVIDIFDELQSEKLRKNLIQPNPVPITSTKTTVNTTLAEIKNKVKQYKGKKTIMTTNIRPSSVIIHSINENRHRKLQNIIDVPSDKELIDLDTTNSSISTKHLAVSTSNSSSSIQLLENKPDRKINTQSDLVEGALEAMDKIYPSMTSKERVLNWNISPHLEDIVDYKQDDSYKLEPDRATNKIGKKRSILNNSGSKCKSSQKIVKSLFDNNGIRRRQLNPDIDKRHTYHLEVLKKFQEDYPLPSAIKLRVAYSGKNTNTHPNLKEVFKVPDNNVKIDPSSCSSDNIEENIDLNEKCLNDNNDSIKTNAVTDHSETATQNSFKEEFYKYLGIDTNPCQEKPEKIDYFPNGTRRSLRVKVQQIAMNNIAKYNKEQEIGKIKVTTSNINTSTSSVNSKNGSKNSETNLNKKIKSQLNDSIDIKSSKSTESKMNESAELNATNTQVTKNDLIDLNDGNLNESQQSNLNETNASNNTSLDETNGNENYCLIACNDTSIRDVDILHKINASALVNANCYLPDDVENQPHVYKTRSNSIKKSEEFLLQTAKQLKTENLLSNNNKQNMTIGNSASCGISISSASSLCYQDDNVKTDISNSNQSAILKTQSIAEVEQSIISNSTSQNALDHIPNKNKASTLVKLTYNVEKPAITDNNTIRYKSICLISNAEQAIRKTNSFNTFTTGPVKPLCIQKKPYLLERRNYSKCNTSNSSHTNLNTSYTSKILMRRPSEHSDSNYDTLDPISYNQNMQLRTRKQVINDNLVEKSSITDSSNVAIINPSEVPDNIAVSIEKLSTHAPKQKLFKDIGPPSKLPRLTPIPRNESTMLMKTSKQGSVSDISTRKTSQQFISLDDKEKAMAQLNTLQKKSILSTISKDKTKMKSSAPTTKRYNKTRSPLKKLRRANVLNSKTNRLLLNNAVIKRKSMINKNEKCISNKADSTTQSNNEFNTNAVDNPLNILLSAIQFPDCASDFLSLNQILGENKISELCSTSDTKISPHTVIDSTDFVIEAFCEKINAASNIRLSSKSLHPENGLVIAVLYTNNTVITVQELKISFWKYPSQLYGIFGYPQQWECIGDISRQNSDIEIVSPYQNRVFSNDGNAAYIEFRAKEFLPNEFRECCLTSVYLNVYFVDNKQALTLHHVDLVKICGTASSVRYTVLPDARYFVMVWTQQAINHDRCRVCKYSLTPDLDTLANMKQFPRLEHNITNLCCFEDDNLLGFGYSTVTMWNHHTGDLLLNIEIDFPIGDNLACYISAENDAKYMFLVQDFHTDETTGHSLKLLAINLTDSYSCKVMVSHNIPEHYKSVTSTSTTSESLIVTFENGKSLLISLLNPHEIYFKQPEPNNSYELFVHNTKVFKVTNSHMVMKTMFEYLLGYCT